MSDKKTVMELDKQIGAVEALLEQLKSTRNQAMEEELSLLMPLGAEVQVLTGEAFPASPERGNRLLASAKESISDSQAVLPLKTSADPESQVEVDLSKSLDSDQSRKGFVKDEVSVKNDHFLKVDGVELSENELRLFNDPKLLNEVTHDTMTGTFLSIAMYISLSLTAWMAMNDSRFNPTGMFEAWGGLTLLLILFLGVVVRKNFKRFHRVHKAKSAQTELVNQSQRIKKVLNEKYLKQEVKLDRLGVVQKKEGELGEPFY